METPEIVPSALDSPKKTRPSMLARFWPIITNDEEATKAAKSGAYAAATVAVLTSALALIAIGAKGPFLGMDGWGLLDASLFAIVAWRMFKFSFRWAVAGLLLYCAEMAWKWSAQGSPGGNVIVPIIITLALLTGVRGTAFLSKRKGWVVPIIVLIFVTGFAIVVSQSVHQ